MSPSAVLHHRRMVLRDNLVNPRLSVSMPGTPMASLCMEGRLLSGNSSPSVSSASVSTPSIPETNPVGKRPLPPLLVDCTPSDSSRSCADTAVVSSIGSTGYQQRAFDFVDKEEDEENGEGDHRVDIVGQWKMCPDM
jgi:hypothetical protein